MGAPGLDSETWESTKLGQGALYQGLALAMPKPQSPLFLKNNPRGQAAPGCARTTPNALHFPSTMPKLDWLTRPEDERIAAAVPYRLLEAVPSSLLRRRAHREHAHSR